MSRAICADGLRRAVGFFNLLLGALFIVAPHRLDAPMHGGTGLSASGLGLGLIVSGMALICANVLVLPRPLVVAAHLGTAASLFLVSVAFMAASFWPGPVAYFGAAMVALPWEPGRRLIDGSSFGSQLTVALLGITVIVITSTIAFLGEREERSAVAAQLRVNQALAEALSANVAEYVRHH